MRCLPALLAGALFLLWMPWQGPALAQTVLSGSEGSVGEAGPEILRGSAIEPKPAPARTTRLERAALASGRKLWLLDRVSGRLLVCERNFGVMVGERFIRCTGGRLPVRFRQ